MPENLYFPDDRISRPVATADELMDFVNKIREAGGADVITAFFPSEPFSPKLCLIARALNFDCAVDTSSYGSLWANVFTDWPTAKYFNGDTSSICYPDTHDAVWVMKVFHGNVTESRIKAQEIATKLKIKFIYNELFLPYEIRNAAYAFDAGVAYTQYVQD